MTKKERLIIDFKVKTDLLTFYCALQKELNTMIEQHIIEDYRVIEELFKVLANFESEG